MLDITITKSHYDAIQRVCDYIMDTEGGSFDECLKEGSPPEDHIYAVAMLLSESLMQRHQGE